MQGIEGTEGRVGRIRSEDCNNVMTQIRGRVNESIKERSSKVEEKKRVARHAFIKVRGNAQSEYRDATSNHEVIDQISNLGGELGHHRPAFRDDELFFRESILKPTFKELKFPKGMTNKIRAISTAARENISESEGLPGSLSLTRIQTQKYFGDDARTNFFKRANWYKQHRQIMTASSSQGSDSLMFDNEENEYFGGHLMGLNYAFAPMRPEFLSSAAAQRQNIEITESRLNTGGVDITSNEQIFFPTALEEECALDKSNEKVSCGTPSISDHEHGIVITEEGTLVLKKGRRTSEAVYSSAEKSARAETCKFTLPDEASRSILENPLGAQRSISSSAEICASIGGRTGIVGIVSGIDSREVSSWDLDAGESIQSIHRFGRDDTYDMQDTARSLSSDSVMSALLNGPYNLPLLEWSQTDSQIDIANNVSLCTSSSFPSTTVGATVARVKTPASVSGSASVSQTKTRNNIFANKSRYVPPRPAPHQIAPTHTHSHPLVQVRMYQKILLSFYFSLPDLACTILTHHCTILILTALSDSLYSFTSSM